MKKLLLVGLLLIGCGTCETAPKDKMIKYPCKCTATIEFYHHLWYCDCPTMTCLVRDSARPSCLPKPVKPPAEVPR